MNPQHFMIEYHDRVRLLRLCSSDGTNRLTRACVLALMAAVRQLAAEKPQALIVTGNEHFFSAGADLAEIALMEGPEAYIFALMGQALMNALDGFPAPVYAAVRGYCMGGGLDLALACAFRFAHPHSIFGHRGSALGLITGWGGTQRLPRLVGKANALQMLVAAEKVSAQRAVQIGLAHCLAEDPVRAAFEHARSPAE